MDHPKAPLVPGELARGHQQVLARLDAVLRDTPVDAGTADELRRLVAELVRLSPERLVLAEFTQFLAAVSATVAIGWQELEPAFRRAREVVALAGTHGPEELSALAGGIRPPTPNAEELVREWTSARARFRTYRRTYGAYVYWAVDVYPAGWPRRSPAAVEMALADRRRQGDVEASAEAWAAEDLR